VTVYLSPYALLLLVAAIFFLLGWVAATRTMVWYLTTYLRFGEEEAQTLYREWRMTSVLVAALRSLRKPHEQEA
jgi:hypothetical protein